MTTTFYARIQRARNNHVKIKTPDAPRIDPRAPALDHRRARNIPILGPMAGGGAIPGTRPDQRNLTRTTRYTPRID